MDRRFVRDHIMRKPSILLESFSDEHLKVMITVAKERNYFSTDL